jgi:hypothetical protein
VILAGTMVHQEADRERLDVVGLRRPRHRVRLTGIVLGLRAADVFAARQRQQIAQFRGIYGVPGNDDRARIGRASWKATARTASAFISAPTAR